jgi:hypothetical protein
MPGREVKAMPTDDLHVYEIQSRKNRDEWYQVVLKPVEDEIRKSCTCKDYLWRGKECQHIRAALECYDLGF